MDLIIVKNMRRSPNQEATAIRKAWRPLRWTLGSLPFDLLVVDEEEHRERILHSAGFYDQSVAKGLRLV